MALQTFRHVIITGASSGLGAAIAEHYAAPGRVLSLTGRNTERLAQVAARCHVRGAEVMTATIDVTNAAAMEAWLLERDDAAPADLVISNAGIGGSAALTAGLTEDGALARDIIGINTIGVVNTVTPLLSRFVARRSGALAVVGSIAGGIGLPHSPAYCGSKAAVTVYCDALRRLLRPHGIAVTTVLPGFIDTPMSRSLGLRRPFCWRADAAAARIARDIAKERRRSVFPWQLQLALWTQHLMPLALTDFILTRSVGASRAIVAPP